MATKVKAKKDRKTNPNGVNQYTPPDPRQQLFLAHYLNPAGSTFSNALQSALKAGYTEEYATALISRMPKWLAEKITESTMLSKAERNLDEILDMDVNSQAMGAFGPIFENVGDEKIPVMVVHNTKLKVKADVSKFIAERLGRKKYGEGPKEGVKVQFNFFDGEQIRKVAARALNDDPEITSAPGGLPDSDQS